MRHSFFLMSQIYSNILFFGNILIDQAGGKRNKQCFILYRYAVC